MILQGTLINCKRETKEFKGTKQREKLYITLADVELTQEQLDELQTAFKNVGSKFTPSWVEDFQGYVNLSTQFDLPCRTIHNKEYLSVEDAISDEDINWFASEVKVSIKIKDGAIYPNSIIFLTEGKEINPFEEFDE